MNDEETCASCGCESVSCECDHQQEIRDRDNTITELNDKLIEESGRSDRLRDRLSFLVLMIESGVKDISVIVAKEELDEYDKARAK